VRGEIGLRQGEKVEGGEIRIGSSPCGVGHEKPNVDKVWPVPGDLSGDL